ncbi:MAG: hypothetical protein ACJ72K_01055 [Friedmanniella sp.]|jgi:hypothetical protein
MYVDSARELKARLADRLARHAPLAARRVDLAGWRVPALGLVPVGPDQAHLAIRLVTEDEVAVVLSGLDEVVLKETDLRVIGAVRPLQAPAAPPSPAPIELRRRSRPLRPGSSVAHPAVSAGTLGGFVRTSGRLAMLSNNHVLAASDTAAVGDPILQPGPADGGEAIDRVATLAAFERFRSGQASLVDAAVAVLDDGVAADPRAYPGGPLSGAVPASIDLDPDEEVEKIGRTTAHTVGRITAVEVDGVAVQYDDAVHTFDDQIEIEGLAGAFSAGGDSGSVIWRRRDRAALGLLFAGSTMGGSRGGGVTYANPLATVLTTLDLEWVSS